MAAAGPGSRSLLSALTGGGGSNGGGGAARPGAALKWRPEGSAGAAPAAGALGGAAPPRPAKMAPAGGVPRGASGEWGLGGGGWGGVLLRSGGVDVSVLQGNPVSKVSALS